VRSPTNRAPGSAACAFLVAIPRADIDTL